MPISAPSQGLEIVEYQAILRNYMSDSNLHDFWAMGSSTASDPWISQWSSSVTGTGSTVTFPVTASLPPGVMQITAGTTATGASLITSDSQNIYLPSGSFQFSWRFSLANLSDGTDTFLARAGLGVTWNTSADITDGVYVEYRHTQAGGAFRLAAASGGVRTYANGITPLVAGQYYLVDIVYTAQPEVNASLFIDGNFECELYTGFPATTVAMAICGGQIIKSAGVTARDLFTDLVYFGIAFPAGR